MSTTYNGIVEPEAWPPRDQDPASFQPMRVPYLERPPAVVPIDLGRQLFVDDFLVEASDMTRRCHTPAKHPGNPIFFPQSEHELNAALAPATIPKCGGVWYDEEARQFKMWYMASYLGAMCCAVSEDGIHWERPALDVVPGTNLILPADVHPDSGTVWLDADTRVEGQRYKMMIREPNGPGRPRRFPARLFVSADGIHWREIGHTGPMDDRSTMFYNPFRKRWVQSIREGVPRRGRARLYWEHEDFLESGRWQEGEPPYWCGADCMDQGGAAAPQLYNLDAVAYESLMAGFFQILKGPPNHIGHAVGQPKLTELVLATSRDGFHWHRPDRRAFIGACREPGSWEFGYVESTGGVLLVVGDELWFYYSAYAGAHERVTEDWRTNGMYANGAVGLAKLRRDGFASLRAGFPGASATTRPLRFGGSRLFVNANTAGALLRVECLDEHGRAVDGFAAADCAGFCGNATKTEIRWQNGRTLADLRNRPVRFRFSMDRGDLYAFWVTDSPTGESGGYRGAGGPAA
jgi:hypothetical protein